MLFNGPNGRPNFRRGAGCACRALADRSTAAPTPKVSEKTRKLAPSAAPKCPEMMVFTAVFFLGDPLKLQNSPYWLLFIMTLIEMIGLYMFMYL